MDGLGAALGKTFSEVLDYDPTGTSELIFATRLKRDEAEIVIPVDNLVCEEFVNAYKDGNRVILDMIAAGPKKGAPSGKKQMRAPGPSSGWSVMKWIWHLRLGRRQKVRCRRICVSLL